jgi:3-hydroxy-3-methylglutaryl CoA synthase/uncharacterized OB-fold protein
MNGIHAYGAYIPRLRLQRSAVVQAHQWFAPALRAFARGERAMANWDEDAITLAVEAARDALPEAQRSAIGTVVLASTSTPFADRQNAGIVKEALNLSDDVLSLDVGGSQKCGTGALIQALRSNATSRTLCVAAERPAAKPASEAELLQGDAAAAIVVGPGEGIARFVGSHSVAIDFVDHFRAAAADHDYGWESRWVREEGYSRIASGALRAALKRLDIPADSVSHFIVAIPVKGVAESLAKAAGIAATAVRDNLTATLGHAGSAQPLVMLAHALAHARPGERIVVLAFGQGCDVLVLETTNALADHPHPRGVDGWLSRRQPEFNYFKRLAFTGALELERGMRAELEQKQPLTALYRSRRTVLALMGARDRLTGAVQYPRTTIAVGAETVGEDTLEDYPLAERHARVFTYTADSLAYSPDPPGCYGMLEFEGGGRMLAEFTDVDPATISVGMAMRMSFRIKAVDERRSFTKYFWKATPVA